VALLIAAGAAAWMSTDDSSEPTAGVEPAAESGATDPPAPSPEGESDAPPPAPSEPTPAPPPPAEPVTVAIEGKGPLTSWVQIRRDGAAGDVVFEGIFTDGVRRQWTTDERLWLRVGDTEGIVLTVDGEAQALDGPRTVDYTVGPDGLAPT
jgi:hypothetical protein